MTPADPDPPIRPDPERVAVRAAAKKAKRLKKGKRAKKKHRKHARCK